MSAQMKSGSHRFEELEIRKLEIEDERLEIEVGDG